MNFHHRIPPTELKLLNVIDDSDSDSELSIEIGYTSELTVRPPVPTTNTYERRPTLDDGGNSSGISFTSVWNGDSATAVDNGQTVPARIGRSALTGIVNVAELLPAFLRRFNNRSANSHLDRVLGGIVRSLALTPLVPASTPRSGMSSFVNQNSEMAGIASLTRRSSDHSQTRNISQASASSRATVRVLRSARLPPRRNTAQAGSMTEEERIRAFLNNLQRLQGLNINEIENMGEVDGDYLLQQQQYPSAPASPSARSNDGSLDMALSERLMGGAHFININSERNDYTYLTHNFRVNNQIIKMRIGLRNAGWDDKRTDLGARTPSSRILSRIPNFIRRARSRLFSQEMGELNTQNAQTA